MKIMNIYDFGPVWYNIPDRIMPLVLGTKDTLWTCKEITFGTNV